MKYTFEIESRKVDGEWEPMKGWRTVLDGEDFTTTSEFMNNAIKEQRVLYTAAGHAEYPEPFWAQRVARIEVLRLTELFDGDMEFRLVTTPELIAPEIEDGAVY